MPRIRNVNDGERIKYDLRLLESFMALAEELHFGRAAAKLEYAQPAISQQIRRLELQLGVSLFRRDRRTVSLTPAGEAFRERAQVSLLAAREAGQAAVLAAHASRTERLVTDLERLVAIEAIRALMARYVRFADNKQWTELTETFLPDGTFIAYDVEGKPLLEMHGRADIARAIDGSIGCGLAFHHLFSYEVQLTSPTTATGVFSMEDMVIRPDGEPPVHDDAGMTPFRALRGFGHYHARYQRVDGEWFIAEMTKSRLPLTSLTDS